MYCQKKLIWFCGMYQSKFIIFHHLNAFYALLTILRENTLSAEATKSTVLKLEPQFLVYK